MAEQSGKIGGFRPGSALPVLTASHREWQCTGSAQQRPSAGHWNTFSQAMRVLTVLKTQLLLVYPNLELLYTS